MTPPPEIQATARQFLVGSDSVAHGFGLYSYVLFDRRPMGQASITLFRATLESLIGRFEPADSLLGSFKQEELNVTFIPVTEAPPSEGAPGDTETIKLNSDGARLAQWSLDHYNHPRARTLLGWVKKGLQDGPYLVSVRHPLEGRLAPGEHCLLLSLNGATPAEADAWVRHFADQVLKPRYWDDHSLEKAALDLRKALTSLGVAAPRIKAALLFLTVPEAAAAGDSTS